MQRTYANKNLDLLESKQSRLSEIRDEYNKNLNYRAIIYQLVYFYQLSLSLTCKSVMKDKTMVFFLFRMHNCVFYLDAVFGAIWVPTWLDFGTILGAK